MALNKDFKVKNSICVGDSLNVTGSACIGGDTTIHGNLSVCGDETILRTIISTTSALSVINGERMNLLQSLSIKRVVK